MVTWACVQVVIYVESNSKFVFYGGDLLVFACRSQCPCRGVFAPSVTIMKVCCTHQCMDERAFTTSRGKESRWHAINTKNMYQYMKEKKKRKIREKKGTNSMDMGRKKGKIEYFSVYMYGGYFTTQRQKRKIIVLTTTNKVFVLRIHMYHKKKYVLLYQYVFKPSSTFKYVSKDSAKEKNKIHGHACSLTTTKTENKYI